MIQQDPEFAQDLLRSAEAIAEFLYGDREMRRKVYHLAATSNLPFFKLGSTICARKSVLLRWIEDQESRHSARHFAAGSEASRSRQGHFATTASSR